MCFSATETLSPVRGLRPTRASRRLTENAPKPRNSTRSPRASAAAISSKDRGNDDLDVALIKMGVGVGKPLYELRFRHRSSLPPCQGIQQPAKPPAAVKAATPAQRLLLGFALAARRLIAAPRMSPRLAPESDDPNSAIARFSSSTSRALIDKVSLRVARSIVVILASTFSPTAKRSGRCSLRSRDSSGFADKAGDAVADHHLDTAIIGPRDRAGDDLALLQLGHAGFERVGRELLDAEADALLFDIDVEHLHAHRVALAIIVDRLLARSVPIDVGHMDHAVDIAGQADKQTEFGNVANLAFELAADRGSSTKASHGLASVCFRPRLMRRFCGSTSSTITSTSWLVETILPGCTFFLVQLISETWTSPSTPGSSSTNAP